ncbi:ATP-dependent DNA helicase PIF1, partial [Trifolium medium]|nr:ATP-dependent DNA helicase PIF1 [Trifolium medium]
MVMVALEKRIFGEHCQPRCDQGVKLFLRWRQVIGSNEPLAHLIRRAKLIIWDEAPMMHKHCFEAVDRTLRDIMNEKRYPFGGKVVVLGGDFRQILPVIPKGTSIGDADDEYMKIQIPHDLLIYTSGDPLASIVGSTYPNLLHNMKDPSFFSDRAILAPKNAIVDAVNEYML